MTPLESPTPLARTRSATRFLRPLAVTLVIAASLAAFWVYLKTERLPHTFDAATASIGTGVGLGVGLDVGFALVDHHGRPVSLADFHGAPLLVLFGYTGCPDVCPTTLARVAEVLDDLESEGTAAQGVFVTLDPARDTPAVLASYVEVFHPRLTGLSGDEASLKEAARRFRVFYERVGDDPEEYFLDHSAYVYLLGADGALLAYYHPDLAAETLSVDVRRRLRQGM